MPDADDLARTLAERISEHGPISMAAWMQAAGSAYYAAKDPLGARGDFITAPEISQMFGEMIGLWCADMVQRSGASRPHYVELGPGRGTLAADALRAASRHGWHPAIHLVESSPALADIAGQRLPNAVVHESIDSLPDSAPMIVIANEFFDALPVHQYIRTENGWRERMVGHDKARGFHAIAGKVDAESFIPPGFRNAPVDSIWEARHAAAATVMSLGERIARQGGVMLIIDYGHVQSAHGDTVQAMHRHQYTDIFDSPGEQDITAHVDFAALAKAGEIAGLSVSAPTTQGAFLGALGIGHRAQALATQNPDQADNIMQALNRLTHAEEMGELFKVMALYSQNWPDPAGL